MATKKEALNNIVLLAKQHGITIAEIEKLLKSPANKSETLSSSDSTEKNSILMKVFAYVGGIFVLSGVGVYLNMFWEVLGSPARVLITFGTGFALYIWAVVATKTNKKHGMIIPVFLLSAFLQMTGLFVFLHEYFPPTNDHRNAVIVVMLVMLVQQLISFISLKQTVLLLNSFFFGGALLLTLFDKVGLSEGANYAITGVTMLLLTFRTSTTEYRAISGFCYFVSSMYFLAGMFKLLEDSPLEVLYLGVTAAGIYISTVIKSKTTLFSSVLWMIIFISFFSHKYFAQSVGWPLTLIFLGIVFILISVYSIKLSKKYM